MEKRGSTYDWQRQFFVTDHIKHKNGFTLYKITSVVFPKKNPEAGTKIIVWKRFNEFKSLYKELKHRHEVLHIGGDFPKLVKGNFFDRFSEEVIKERKKCIVELLNFVAKCPALFTADIFVKFFREGYQISEYDDRKYNRNDSHDDESDVDSIWSSLGLLNMGQVLNADGSQSSDESISGNSVTKRTKSKNAAYNRFKRDMQYDRSSFGISSDENSRFSFVSRFTGRGVPDYWEEAVAHADEAHQQEMLANYDVAFAMYKTAIVCLLSGIQGDNDKDNKTRVKELTQEYLHKAEWIYRHHLVYQDKPATPKFSRIPWRSRSQLSRYKVLSVLSNNLLVHDVTENTFVVVKGVLKSSCPLDRSEICVLPKDVPHMTKLYALHETESTVFFVLEHVRYGKLWDHLEHYFNGDYIVDNLDTEITCASPQDKDQAGSDDRNSVASSGSSTNDQSLSRLESSIYTDTMSCESLSSHDENYFDLIEDYARAKSQKLKEIQDFNERRQQVESLRPVKKTVSQVDLKMMDDNYGNYRSQSLTDLAHENESFDDGIQVCLVTDESPSDDGYKLPSYDENGDELIDMDTQQLLRNAQRLIESINETLSKSEILIDDAASNEELEETEPEAENLEPEQMPKQYPKVEAEKVETVREWSASQSPDVNIRTKEQDFYGAISPFSESIPSITEEYSVTAVLQRNGVTADLIRKWSAQILVAIDVIHQNGIICRDLNPNNILLADNGSVKLTYFYRYPNLDPTINAYAKEKLYVAPEVNNINSNITFAADWWSYGAILYELFTAQSLYNNHSSGINSHTLLNIPDKIDIEAKSLLNELLKYDPNERLGAGITGADDIKAHQYFRGTNWDDIC